MRSALVWDSEDEVQATNVGGRVEAYAVIRVYTVDTDLAHGENDGLCTIQGVSVDGWAVRHELLVRETILVDNLHLLDDGRFS